MKTPKVFTHKKFQVGISTFVMLLFTHLVPAFEASPTFASALGMITVEQWLLIVAPLLTAVAAQGAADRGKEAAIINNGGKK